MRFTIGHLFTWALLAGCTTNGNDGPGASPSSSPYALGQALVIGESAGAQLVPVDDSCDSDACNAVRERCGKDAYAEVVVGADGAVLDVVCFRGNAHFEPIGDEAVPSASAGNGSVLVFDAVDDGDDVTGDVVLTGNNAVIYGQGAAVSRIGGDVSIDKNNAIVRGISIGGDVRIEKNNAQLSFVEIFGDLTIEGNNTTLAASTVHGQVVIAGVNTVLVRDRFFGVEALSGKNLECNGNVHVERAEPASTDAGLTASAPDGAESDAGNTAASDAGASEVESPLVCSDVKGSPAGRGRH